MRRIATLLVSAVLLLPLTGCGCIPEPDPNLREIPQQKNCGGCGPAIGVSPTVPYRIEGGSGWR